METAAWFVVVELTARTVLIIMETAAWFVVVELTARTVFVILEAAAWTVLIIETTARLFLVIVESAAFTSRLIAKLSFTLSSFIVTIPVIDFEGLALQEFFFSLCRLSGTRALTRVFLFCHSSLL